MKKKPCLNGYGFYAKNLLSLFGQRHFVGWGRKRTGRFAVWCAKNFNGRFTLKEDGFLRSVRLGIEGSPSFSEVQDDIGIYYDATCPSRLEQLLQNYDFKSDVDLLKTARKAIDLITSHQLSKYNHAPDAQPDWFEKDERRVLVITQTRGDESLRYGLGTQFSTLEMIQAAIEENPGAQVYVKIHPDVLSGKKLSDLNVADLPANCQLIDKNANPISLLGYFDKVYTKTSLMGFEALLLGKEVVCFGMPFYAGWGGTEDRVSCTRRQRQLTVDEIFSAAYILYSHYFNPFTGQSLTILEAIEELLWYREKFRESLSFEKAFFFGFSRWKHGWLPYFFDEIRKEQLVFVNPVFSKQHLFLSKQRGLSSKSRIYIWGRRPFPEVESFAKQQNIPIFRVEDGFIRSFSLGSDLTQPYSLVVDSKGIYFDPTQRSDLEDILNTYDFASAKALLARSNALILEILKRKLSKYNSYHQEQNLELPDNQKLILVPGQVEDDASIRYGANGMTNLELLQQVRENCPNSFIIFKPHPDVLAGNRIGNVPQKEALSYCDQVIENASIDCILHRVDEVHTMTSLVGFEALLRQKKVVTYGMPFYAGWGLTEDMLNNSNRTRNLSLEALVAGTLLLYPRYIEPRTGNHCSIETMLDYLDEFLQDYKDSVGLRYRMGLRNNLVRFGQKVLRLFKK